MPEFTHLVRQRLALGRPMDVHPDADTLSAYVEKLLPTAEQSRVVEHLALCGECREVIMLASTTAAEPEPAVAAVVTPARRTGRAWAPLFGLAASFVAVAVMAVLLARAPQQTHSSVASNPAPPTPEQAKMNEPAPGPEPPVAALVTHNEQAPTHPEATAVAKPRRAESRAMMANGGLIDGEMPPPPPVFDAERAAESSIRAIAASAAAPSREEYLNSQRFAGPAANQSQNVPNAVEIPGTGTSRNVVVAGNIQLPTIADVAKESARSQGAPSSTEHGMNFLTPFKEAGRHIMQLKTPAINEKGLGFSAMGGAGQFNPARDKSQSAEVTAAVPKTETAELDQSQAFTRRAMSPAAAARVKAASEPSWSVGNGKLLKTDETGAWVSGYSGTEGIEFSTVTSRGSEVWAGGNHATLLHSVDGGGSWEKLRLGSNASGQITSISANGPNVHLTTSEGQSWSSQDGGKSWTQD